MRFVSKTIYFVVCFLAVFVIGFSLANAQSIAEFLPKADLIEMLCLTSKWQTNNLSALIGAYQEQNKDLQLVKGLAEMTGQVDVVCQSQEYEGALETFADFAVKVQSAEAQLREVDKSIENNFTQQMNGLIDKMTSSQKKSLAGLVSQEKLKKEKELENFARQLSQKAQIELEQNIAQQSFPDTGTARQYAFSITEQMTKILQNQVDDFATRAKNELRQIAQAKAIEFLGKQVAGFASTTQESQKVKDALLAAYQAKAKAFEQDKVNALKKQAQTADLFLEKEIRIIQNQESPADKTISNRLKDIQQAFNEKQRAAVANASQSDFLTAFSELKTNRQATLNQAPSLFFKTEGSQKFCVDNINALNSRKPQLVNLAEKIAKVEHSLERKISRCKDNPINSGCYDLIGLVGELSALKQDIADFSQALDIVNRQCDDEAVNNVKVLGMQISQNVSLWKAQWPKYKAVISQYF